MKKTISLFLALMLLAAGLVSCTQKSQLSPHDPVTLTLWHVYGEQSDSPMNQLIQEFNNTIGREKGIIISVTNVTSTSKIANQLLDAQANVPGALTMPDLFSCHTNTAVLLGSDNLVDWTEYFSKTELEAYVPEFIQDGTMNERFCVFPVSKSTYALFINGSQFARFSADTGVTYESLSTWDGFFDAAARYYEWSDGKTFCAFDYLIRHIELDMLACSGDFQYTEDGWYDLNDPALYDSWMKFAAPLAQGHIAVADLYANTQVMTGESLAGIGSTAAISYYNDTVTYPDNTSEPTDLHVLPLPHSTADGKEYMPQTGVGLAAYQTTPQKAEAAAIFLKWFTQGDRNLDFVASTGYMPVHNDAYDAIASYHFDNESYASLYQAIYQMKATYTPVVRPDFGNFYARTNLLYDQLRQQQALFSERADQGESIDILTAAIWDLFCSIE